MRKFVVHTCFVWFAGDTELITMGNNWLRTLYGWEIVNGGPQCNITDKNNH